MADFRAARLVMPGQSMIVEGRPATITSAMIIDGRIRLVGVDIFATRNLEQCFEPNELVEIYPMITSEYKVIGVMGDKVELLDTATFTNHLIALPTEPRILMDLISLCARLNLPGILFTCISWRFEVKVTKVSELTHIGALDLMNKRLQVIERRLQPRS